MFFEKIAFLLSGLTLPEAEGGQFCYEYEDDQSTTKKIHFCDTVDFEKCCSTGCCSQDEYDLDLRTKENPTDKTYPATITFWVLAGISLAVLAIVYCKKCIKKVGFEGDESPDCSPRPRRVPLHLLLPNDQETTNDSPDYSPRAPSEPLNLLLPNHREIHPSAPTENTPITPPPDYNTALEALLRHSENEIPSYEEVMAADRRERNCSVRSVELSETGR